MPNGKNGNGNGGRRRKGNGGKRAVRARTSRAQPVVQGGAMVPTVAFGSQKMGKNSTDALNALHPSHLSLPRPIAPYVVVRGTGIFSLSDTTGGLSIWGPMRNYAGSARNFGLRYGGRWSNSVGVGAAGALSTQIGATDSALSYNIDVDGWGPGTTLVPSAFTIQIINPEALQGTNGFVWVGRLSNRAILNESNKTWDEAAAALVQFQAPRMLAAAKLAFRGVTVDAIPSDMNALSEFTSIAQPYAYSQDGTAFTWSGIPSVGASTDDNYEFSGFLPIFIYNPSSIGLQVQVTVEYRLRFDPFHPATSSHRYHPPSSMSIWDNCIRTMQTIGHGVKDIADVVANAGQAYGSFLNATGRGQGTSVPMLVD
jgi:hypothetical protein